MILNTAVDINNRDKTGQLNLDLYDPDSDSRQHVENFIRQVFVRAYDADLSHYLPRLMALHDKEHKTVAALGMREASSGGLFLECYLDAPVEEVISQHLSINVARHQIVEVGNLASIHRGGLRQLIIALTSYLSGAGTEWVVFTAVPAVSKAFAAMGLNLHSLAVADKSRLNEAEQASWGRYYESDPIVVAGRVEEGYQRLRELIVLEKAMSMSCYLWQYAFAAGCQQRNINAKTVTRIQG